MPRRLPETPDELMEAPVLRFGLSSATTERSSSFALKRRASIITFAPSSFGSTTMPKFGSGSIFIPGPTGKPRGKKKIND